VDVQRVTPPHPVAGVGIAGQRLHRFQEFARRPHVTRLQVRVREVDSALAMVSGSARRRDSSDAVCSTQLHARIAKVLEKDFSDQVANEPEPLAHHFTQAGITKQAIGYWHLAGQRGTAPGLSRGGRLLPARHRAAGTLADAPDVAAVELGLQIGLGFAFIPTKGHTAPESLRAFTRARTLCQQTGEIGPLFGPQWELFVLSLVAGSCAQPTRLPSVASTSRSNPAPPICYWKAMRPEGQVDTAWPFPSCARRSRKIHLYDVRTVDTH
jgi:hypothetical protein